MKSEILNKNVTVAILQDTRPHCANANNEFPVKIRIIYLRNAKYVSMKYFFSCENYKQMFSTKRVSNEMQKIRNIIENRKDEIIEIINEHFKEHFNFDTFFAKLKEIEDIKSGAVNKDTNVFNQIELQIEKLKAEGRLGTMQTYKGTLGSLKLFHKKNKLDFYEITTKFLNDYQNFMLKNDKALTTIGIYLRTLRAVYNTVINNGIIENKFYPFGTKGNKYEIPNTEKSKEALSEDEISKLFDYECSTVYEQNAKDLFLFSYLCNGINLADILRMKYKQVTDNKITFVREKTKRTTKNRQKELQVILTNELKSIILPILERQATVKNPDNYIFAYLTDEMTDEQQYAKIKDITHLTNNHLKRICTKLSINKNISTMVARHSYTSNMIINGANIHYLKENLGHKNSKTTESYIHSIGIPDKLINSLIPENIRNKNNT